MTWRCMRLRLKMGKKAMPDPITLAAWIWVGGQLFGAVLTLGFLVFAVILNWDEVRGWFRK